MGLGALHPGGQAMLLVRQCVECHAEFLAGLAVASFTNDGEFGFHRRAHALDAVLKIHGLCEQAFQCRHIHNVGQTLWRGRLQLQLTARVTPDLHGLNRRGMLRVGPTTQIAQQFLAAGVQRECAHIVGLLRRTHQCHAQPLAGQQQRQAAAHHAAAADAHIKVGRHVNHCRSCLPVEFLLSRTTPGCALKV